jgi:hypothetical protein
MKGVYGWPPIGLLSARTGATRTDAASSALPLKGSRGCSDGEDRAPVSPGRRTRRGYLVLADISGYTALLAGTELEHATAIVYELTTLIRERGFRLRCAS